MKYLIRNIEVSYCIMCDALGSAYQEEWQSLFCAKYYVENLRSSALKGKLRNSHFRSICWKVFLECLPENQEQHSWINTIKLQRKHYDEILDKLQINPRKVEGTMDISVNNPLSQSVQSPWNQYFQDSELRITIQQDVVRTFPEVEFFHSPKIQEMMINILFSYAREYPHISYRQGMHELLAPIIFVLHYDQQYYLEVSKTDNLELDIRIILNQNYTEHDVFFLFCNLMEAVEAWYTMTESPYSKCMSLVSAEPFTEDSSSPVNSLGLKLKNIYKNLLKLHDTELFLYLEQMEITPQIYGIRWLRLLFGREFPIHDLLIIWDAIFADGVPFNLVDYIFVAMLIAIRDLLLKSDYASCLRHLMHYPSVTDVQYIIDLALHLRDPSMAKPDVNFIQVFESPSKYIKETKTSVKRAFSKTVFSSQTKSATLTKAVETRPKSLKITDINTTVKDSVNVNMGLDESQDVCIANSKINYNTFPRTSIRNVMEGRNLKFKSLDVSQNFGLIGDTDTTGKNSLCREMVPLVPSQNSPENWMKKSKNMLAKDKNEEVNSFRAEISELRLMNEYCAKQITLHISKLQECMIGQHLLYEDEMFIALAGLKRARDILKGTVAFTEEVINDDHIENYTCCSKKDCSDNVMQKKMENETADCEASDSSIVYNKCSNKVSENQINEMTEKSAYDCDKILDVLTSLNCDSKNLNLINCPLEKSQMHKNS